MAFIRGPELFFSKTEPRVKLGLKVINSSDAKARAQFKRRHALDDRGGCDCQACRLIMADRLAKEAA
jgi:hypothetical protein